MKIWVIGSSGMVGSSLLKRLHLEKIACIGTTSKEVDITKKEEINNFLLKEDFSHIINCAAYTNVEMAEREKEKAFALNAEAVKNLVAQANQVKAKIIHFSTDYVFSGDKNSPYQEEDLSSSLSVYGKSKGKGEEYLLKESSNFCLIRTSWLFGLNSKNFVANILEKMQQQEEIKMVSDQRGRPTFCEDLVEVTLSLLEKAQGIFHYANDKEVSWYEFTKLIYGKAQKYLDLKCKSIVPITTKEYPTCATRPLYSVLSTQKIEAFMQKPVASLDKALNCYFEKKHVKKT